MPLAKRVKLSLRRGEKKELVGRKKTDRGFFRPTPPQLVVLVLTRFFAVRQVSSEKSISMFTIHFNIYRLMYKLTDSLARMSSKVYP